MVVHLTAEDEQLIRKRLQSGAFSSVEEVIHDALASQESETHWFEEQREAINESIAKGIQQLDSGQSVSGEDAHKRLQQRKADWLKNNRK